jgi:hypothetical protein
MHLTSLFLASRGGGSSFEAFDGPMLRRTFRGPFLFTSYSIHVLQSSAVWSSAPFFIVK